MITHTTHSLAIPIPLLSSLIQPSLTGLNFVSGHAWEVTTEYANACLSIIERQASSLTFASFKLRGFLNAGFEIMALKERVSSFFAAFTGLQELHLPLQDTPLIDNIPRSTRWLSIQCSSFITELLEEDQTIILGEFSRHLVGLFEAASNLVEVRMNHHRGNFDGWLGFRDFPRVCKNREIKLGWSGNWNQESS